MSALGAYRDGQAFAYPGWRLTVPGGPAGGHYKGFTHNYSGGTAIGTVADPNDEYELARAEGLAAHDPIHSHPNAPRGVYRGPAEVPPRANASGSAMTYRGFQTKRHAGTSVAPGSFPAEFYETGEDILATMLQPGMGLLPAMVDRYDGAFPIRTPYIPPTRTSVYTAVPSGVAPPPNVVSYSGAPASQMIRIGPIVDGGPPMPGPMPVWGGRPMPPIRPIGPIVSGRGDIPVCSDAEISNWLCSDTICSSPMVVGMQPPATCNRVRQPSTPPGVVQTQAPAPAPSVPAPTLPGGTMPGLAPAPSVPSGVVNLDPSGNFVDAFGNVYSPSDVTLDPTTNQYRLHPGSTPSTTASITSWLTSHSLYSAWPNWYFVAGAGALLLFTGRGRGRR